MRPMPPGAHYLGDSTRIEDIVWIIANGARDACRSAETLLWEARSTSTLSRLWRDDWAAAVYSLRPGWMPATFAPDACSYPTAGLLTAQIGGRDSSASPLCPEARHCSRVNPSRDRQGMVGAKRVSGEEIPRFGQGAIDDARSGSDLLGI
jgi:hypothetical protein